MTTRPSPTPLRLSTAPGTIAVRGSILLVTLGAISMGVVPLGMGLVTTSTLAIS